MTLAVTPGSGATMLTDDTASSGNKVPVSKIMLGAAGANEGYGGSANPFPANISQVGGTAIDTNTLSVPTVIGGMVVYSTAFTRPANTTAYVAGQLVATSTTAATVNTAIGSGTYTIAAARSIGVVTAASRCWLKKSGTSLSNAIFRVHAYNSAPTVSNGDGGNWITGSTGYLGYFDITCTQAFTDGAIGVGTPGIGSLITFAPIISTANLIFLIEARAAYTPVSGETWTIGLEIN